MAGVLDALLDSAQARAGRGRFKEHEHPRHRRGRRDGGQFRHKVGTAGIRPLPDPSPGVADSPGESAHAIARNLRYRKFDPPRATPGPTGPSRRQRAAAAARTAPGARPDEPLRPRGNPVTVKGVGKVETASEKATLKSLGLGVGDQFVTGGRVRYEIVATPGGSLWKVRKLSGEMFKGKLKQMDPSTPGVVKRFRRKGS